MRATRPTSLNRRRSAVALVLFVLSLGILQTGCGDEGEAAAETEPRRSSSRIATVPPDARPEQIAVAARSVAARTHYGLFDATDGRCHALHGLGTETVMPIASAFTLWVLDALVREVSAGRAAWDETLPVQAALRSDPSDEVYALPVGTSVSLRRYAELMISISDNTAADHLLESIGRERVEAAMAAIGVSSADRNTPLLSTADMARLKFVAPETGERYLALSSTEERQRYLDQNAAAVTFPWEPGGDPSAAIDLSIPRRIDELEWFATPGDMCRTMVDLAHLAERPGLGAVAEILSLNPGMPPDLRDQWSAVRFKGGSEPGVLTFVYWLAAPTAYSGSSFSDGATPIDPSRRAPSPSRPGRAY